jgi:hypothetical protein
MVHFTKAFIISTIAIAPIFAAPLQFGQDDVELMTREPWKFNLRKITRGIGRVAKGIGKVARVASFVPGPIGMAAGIASRIIRRDLEEEVFTRAVQDELDARGYDIQLDLREVDDLEARDISDALSTRDNIYTISARALIDSIEMDARSGDLEARDFE